MLDLDIWLWILAQPILSDLDIHPFLFSRLTHHGAYLRLIKNRDVRLICQDEVVELDLHHDFGTYGKSQDPPGLLQRKLQQMNPLDTAILKYAAKIEVNMEVNGVDDNVLQKALQLLQQNTKAAVDLRLTCGPLPVHDMLMFVTILGLVTVGRKSTNLKLSIDESNLSTVSEISQLPFTELNIESRGSTPLPEELSVTFGPELHKFKFMTSAPISGLRFNVKDLCLSNLELEMPIDPLSCWIKDQSLLQLPNLNDLRLLSIEHCSSIHSIFHNTLPVETLYLAFNEHLAEHQDCEIRSLFPQLKTLYLADVGAATTKIA